MTDAGFLRGAAALQALAKSWDAVDAAASAHWRHWSDRLEVHDKAVLKQAGFGTIDTRVSWWRQALHDIHQRRFRPLASPSSDYSHTEKAARVIAAAQGRLFDLDMMRQAITVDFIGGKIALNEIDVICVIGDGFGVLSSLLSKMQKKRKIICLNLTRILYVDLLYANKSLDLNEIALAHDENSLHESLHAEGIKIIGVEAKNAQILKSSPTQLAINIASFQEMDPAIVKAYFLANVAAAETLIAKKMPLLFRVHEEPPQEKL
ncbi:MAG: putative sugar O-methyltransferase, partial [Pseudomonadota bacterium]